MKRVLSVLLSVIIVCGCFGGLVIASVEAASFTPRTEAPSSSNKYYLHTSAGGVNECIIRSGGSVLPNCVGYAWGRAYEILGSRPNLAKTDAKTWYGYNKSNGYYSYGSTPKLGAIMCWAHGSAGHVAVVEKIDGSTITISESHYSGTRFDTRTGTQSQIEGYLNSFQGYIYIGNFGLAPEITSANGDNHTEVTIKWTKVDNATKYTLERRKAGDEGYTTVKSSLTGTSYTDTGLSKNQRYYYKVTAYNGSAKLGTSEPAGVYTKFNPPVVEAVSDSKLKITWDSVAKAESYTIMRRKSSDDSYSEVKTVTSTSYTDSGLSASTQYYYWIRANCNVDGTDLVAKSTSSGQYTFTKAPVIKEVDDISKSEVKVIWDAVSGASSYRIDRRKAGDSAYKTIKSGLTTTSFNDTGLETGQRYYYIVYAKNSAGESAASTAMGGYTKFNAPNIIAEDVNKLNVNWDSVSYAESYTIKRKIYNGEYVDVRKIENTSYGDIGLQSGTQYFYWIQADCNVDGTNIVAKTVSKGQFTFMERPKVSTSSTSVTLSWDAVKGNSTYKYEVLRSALGENGFKVIATTTDTSYTDNNLSPSAGYAYRIKAFDSKTNNCCTETLEAVSINTSDCYHSYALTSVPPTCSVNGTKTYTCTICGGAYTETIPAKGHTEIVDKAVTPSCTDKGLTEGKHCSECNTVIIKQNEVEALGHSAESNWTTVSTSDAGKNTQVKYCSRCGEVVETREVIDSSGNSDTTEPTTESTIIVTEPTEITTSDPIETKNTEPTETTVTDLIETTSSEPTGSKPAETTVTEPNESEATSIATTMATDNATEPTEPSTGGETEPTETSTPDETKPSEPIEDKGLLGDVNCDGKVNVKDATLIQKAAAKITKLTDDENMRADVNGDSKVNVKDATAIQKFAAKIETGFPIGKPIGG